jgi:hypothetical protein
VVYRVSQVAFRWARGVARKDAGALDPFAEDENATSGVIWPLKCQRVDDG